MRIKPAVYGFLTGALLVFVAAFGLVIGFFEFLRPALSPGTELLRGTAESIPAPLVFGILLNGFVYALLFSLIASTRQFFESTTMRVMAITLIIFAFLALTGMIGDLLLLLASPDTSWIFNVGA